MYITYHRDQVPLISKKPPSDVEENAVSDYRPAYLVKVEGMVKVEGTEAKNGYCALSYVWSQSGDIITNGEGKAKRFHVRGHKIIDVQTRSNEEPQARHVNFEELVQQICIDFGVKYIWYDQGCIDQDNNEEKQEAIKEMHKVYRNAKFTVALIPELRVPKDIKKMDWTRVVKHWVKWIGQQEEIFPEGDVVEQCMRDVTNSEWSKRLWTLEEAVMSRHLVMVGTNTHLWLSHRRLLAARYLFIYSSSNPATRTPPEYTMMGKETPSANAILRQAHLRKSTKPHDRAFALANIFAEKVFVEDVNYDLDADAVIQQFYRRLAAVDLTFLCFGKPSGPYESTVDGIYNFPTWTGIKGAHIQDNASPTGLPWNLDDYTVDKDSMRMHINCCKYASYDLASSLLDDDEMGKPRANFGGIQCTHRVDKSSAQDNDGSSDQRPRSTPEIQFSLTEICDTCVILDLPFKWRTKVVFPVVTANEEGVCRSIGICLLSKYDFCEVKICLPSFLDIQRGSFIIA